MNCRMQLQSDDVVTPNRCLNGLSRTFVKCIAGVILLLVMFMRLHSDVMADTVATGDEANVPTQVIIDVGPGYECKSISQAVAIAPEGSIVYVHNGIYTETVKIFKNISLIGESKEGVILRYPCNNYTYPPLEAHCGYYENITIKAYSDGNPVVGNPAYAVHCEKLVGALGNSITFKNCAFESQGTFDVGMGSSNGFTATFDNCSFGNYGIFYHTYGRYTGQPTSATLNMNGCTFVPQSGMFIRNCYSDVSKLNVNLVGNVLPPGMSVVSCMDPFGGSLIDDSYAFGARNVFWNQQ